MKRIVLYFLLLVFWASCRITERYKSLWNATSKNAPASVFQQENEMTLKVSNDATTLYIEVASSSEAVVSKIKELGLAMWLSAGTSPRKTFGIYYPLPYKEMENKVVLDGFSYANSVPIPLQEIGQIQIAATFSQEEMLYKVQIPLDEIQLSSTDVFTIQIASFAAGKEEYLSSLTTEQEIERRLDKYKANPDYQHNENELLPFFYVFELAKMPNKNP